MSGNYMNGTSPADVKALLARIEGERLPLTPEAAASFRAAYFATQEELAETKTELANLKKSIVLEKAKALTDALAANGATIAGCATQIAALTALYPEEPAAT